MKRCAWTLSRLASALLAAAGAGQAAEPTAEPDAAYAELRELLQQRFPQVKLKSIQRTAWPDLYELLSAEEIAYTNAAADWIMLGQLLDARTHENVSARSWDQAQRIDYQSLPFERAIRVVRGDGQRQVAIFEDPHCPYCQELEASLRAIDDVTIHVFLYPLEGLHPGATLLAQRLWCAPDPAAAWTAWMNERVEPAGEPCDANPVEELARLGAKLSINSTPTLFLSNGARISSAIGKDELEQYLTALAPAGATTGKVAGAP